MGVFRSVGVGVAEFALGTSMLIGGYVADSEAQDARQTVVNRTVHVTDALELKIHGLPASGVGRIPRFIGDSIIGTGLNFNLADHHPETAVVDSSIQTVGNLALWGFLVTSMGGATWVGGVRRRS